MTEVPQTCCEPHGSVSSAKSELADDIERARAQILGRRLWLCHLLTAVVIVYYLLRALHHAAIFTVCAHSVALLLMAISLGVLWRGKRLRVSAWFFIAIINTEVGWVSIGDGMSSSLTLWLVATVPMGAALMLDLRATIICTLVAFVDIALIGLLEVYWPIPQEIPNTEADYLVFLLVSFFMLTFVAYLTVNDSNRELHSIALRREKLREAHEAAERSNRAKSRFLAKMSHEIRTPMNGILGMTQHLLHRSLPSPQQQAVTTVHRCGENLLALLNDVLDISKVERGEMELALQRFDLSCTLSELRILFLANAEMTGIQLQVCCDRSPWWCVGDEKRLRQVVSNLVGNAIKFSDGGTVTIALDTREYRDGRSDGGEPRCYIRVQDQGIGMSDIQRSRAFDEFEQGDGGNKRGGTGLGLSIARTLVQNMGGEMRVESELGVGSTFVIALPLQEATIDRSAENATAELASTSQVDAIPTRVLLVDDNAINLRVAMLALEKLNCIVTTAKNGAEAVQEAEQQTFDLILMDIRMPVMDGLQATEKIIGFSALNAQTPIVALTANAYEEDREHCLACGMVDHLAKPFSQKDLEHMLYRWSVAPRLGVPAEEPGPSSPPQPLLDAARG